MSTPLWKAERELIRAAKRVVDNTHIFGSGNQTDAAMRTLSQKERLESSRALKALRKRVRELEQFA